MPDALTREALDQMRCGREHHGKPCDHPQGAPLFFHGRCHPDAPVQAHYVKGQVHINCALCDAPIAAVAVR